MSPTSNARQWLRGLLNQLAGMAVADAQRLAVHHDEAIHALRIRMKKLSAILQLATDDPDKGTVGRVFERVRAIKDGVSELRDVHVLQQVAAKVVKKRLPLSPWVAKPVWSQSKTLTECLALAAEIKQLPLRRVSWEQIAQRHADSYRRARECFRECTDTHKASAFHRWRKRVKTHYFQSLALRRHVDHLRFVRDEAWLGRKLGREHDLTMVDERLDGACSGSRKIHQCIKARRRVLHSDLLKRGKRVFSESCKNFAKKLQPAEPKLATGGV